MAYTISYNRPADSGDPNITIQAHSITTSVFATKEDTAKKCVLTNTASPLGNPELIEYQYNEIADVYNGTGIDRTLWTPSKRGIAPFIKVSEVWTAADPSDASSPQYALPVSFTLRFKVPANSLISETDLINLFKRGIAALYADGDCKLAEIFRGALNPKKG